jgi:hypothetical protein
MSGFALQVASGGRRLTVHCRYCGETLTCPPEEADLWFWLAKSEVKEFYRVHREHAGTFADKCVGAEIEFDDRLTPKEEKEELPPLMNLLDPKNMALIPHG